MKFIIKIFLVLIVITNFTSGQKQNEMRAVKITDVDSQVLFTDRSISDAMDFLATHGFNAVIPVVWNAGVTQYQSPLTQELFGYLIDPQFAGRDPLRIIEIEARRVGIEVYPWFEYGFSSWYSGGTPPFGGHILQKFPKWAARHLNGNICTKNGFDWMQGINPDVQNYIIGMVSEVMRNYDIDGIEFSDRMPALPVECGYDSVTVALYKSDHSGAEPPSNIYDAAWMRWRADKLNQFYRRVKDSVKAYDQNIIVASSPSVHPWAYNEYLQDSPDWVNNDVVEHLIPQLYRYSFADYQYELDRAISFVQTNKRDRIIAGILMNVGNYLITPDFLRQSINLNRARNISGEGYFFYEGLRKNGSQLATILKDEYYMETATVPGRNGFIRRPKGNYVAENDPQNITTTGNWETTPVQGHKEGILWVKDTTYSSISYFTDTQADAFFDVYVYLVTSFSFTDNAKYIVKHKDGESVFILNQQLNSNRGWVKLGTFEFSRGYRDFLTIDNSLSNDGKYLMSDAGMLLINRKLSPNAVVTGIENSEISYEATPGNFALTSYPNPFSENTNLVVKLDEGVSNLKIELFNSIGELIDVIYSGEGYSGEKVYNIQMYNGYTNGVYFIRVTAGNKINTQKLMLIR